MPISGPNLLDAHSGKWPSAWCIVAFSSGTRAHYFRGRDDVRFTHTGLKRGAKPYGVDAIALCGMYADPMQLFEAGSFPHCKNCERALGRT